MSTVITINCPVCNQPLTVPKEDIGKNIVCHSCGQILEFEIDNQKPDIGNETTPILSTGVVNVIIESSKIMWKRFFTTLTKGKRRPTIAVGVVILFFAIILIERTSSIPWCFEEMPAGGARVFLEPSHCKRVKGSVKVPAKWKGRPVREIGAGAFVSFSGITSITIPRNVVFIGECAFGGCEGLTTVRIPNGVRGIGSGAFIGCKNLRSIEIPDSVIFFGKNVFTGCEKLESVTYPDGTPYRAASN